MIETFYDIPAPPMMERTLSEYFPRWLSCLFLSTFYLLTCVEKKYKPNKFNLLDLLILANNYSDI